jgi:hypothetical protein
MRSHDFPHGRIHFVRDVTNSGISMEKILTVKNFSPVQDQSGGKAR